MVTEGKAQVPAGITDFMPLRFDLWVADQNLPVVLSAADDLSLTVEGPSERGLYYVTWPVKNDKVNRAGMASDLFWNAKFYRVQADQNPLFAYVPPSHPGFPNGQRIVTPRHRVDSHELVVEPEPISFGEFLQQASRLLEERLGDAPAIYKSFVFYSAVAAPVILRKR